MLSKPQRVDIIVENLHGLEPQTNKKHQNIRYLFWYAKQFVLLQELKSNSLALHYAIFYRTFL